jgi:hypothetical protein
MVITHPAADKNNLQRGIIFLTDNLSANPCSHYLNLKGQLGQTAFNRDETKALVIIYMVSNLAQKCPKIN